VLCPDRRTCRRIPFITLLLVPVFYAIFVLDLKWMQMGNERKPIGGRLSRTNNVTNTLNRQSKIHGRIMWI